jgi:Predicted GTPases
MTSTATITSRSSKLSSGHHQEFYHPKMCSRNQSFRPNLPLMTSLSMNSSRGINRYFIRWISTTTPIHQNNHPLSPSMMERQRQHLITVAILGPPNAGKSTLFNRLMCKESNKAYKLASEKNTWKRRSRGRIGHNHPSTLQGGAIVSSTPGTTRDRRECIGRIGGTYFTLVDTAGVDGERIDLLSKGKSKKDQMEIDMMKQTLEAAKNADLVFLMFDAKVGVTTDLEETCHWLRKVGAHRLDDDNGSDGDDGAMDSNNIKGQEWKRRVVILGNKLEGDAWSNFQ